MKLEHLLLKIDFFFKKYTEPFYDEGGAFSCEIGMFLYKLKALIK